MLLKLCADDNHKGGTSAEIPLNTTRCINDRSTFDTLNTVQVSGTLFQNIKPLNFAFGWYDKRIDPRLKNESDLRKKIIYCHMKLAALYYDYEKVA